MNGASRPNSTYTITRGLRIPVSAVGHLFADVFEVQDRGPRPTVLIRSPYGRTQLDGDSHFFAARGYNVVVVATRGTDGSDGTFEPMINEADDGPDVVRWLQAQDFYSGHFVTFGGSYLSFVQFALAEHDFPEWDGMILNVGPHDFADAIYRNGVMDLQNFYAWSQIMSMRDEPQRSMISMLRALGANAKQMRSALAEKSLVAAPDATLAKNSPWLADWISNPDTSEPSWDPYRHGEAMLRVRRPMLLTGGWYDLFVDQTLEQWQHYQETHPNLEVWIDRFGHAGGLKGIPEAARLRAKSVDWLDRLYGAAGAPPEAPFTVAVGGARREARSVASWPPRHQPRDYWAQQDGSLAAKPGTGASQFIFDAQDPTPSVGGNILGTGAGPVDNSAVEARSDVIVLTSAPLTSDLLVIGHPLVRLTAEASQPDFDVFVRLCEVRGKKSINVTDRITRLNGYNGEPIEISMTGTAYRFEAGSRVRLLISGSAFPRFALHPAIRNATEAPARTRIEVSFENAGLSVELPVIEG